MSSDAAAPVETLAVRLRDGDAGALAEAFAEHSRLVHSLALRALGNHHDAEDVTQQVFVSAWRGRHNLDPLKGPLGAWLVGITKNAIADLQSQRARRIRDFHAVAAQPAAPSVPPVDGTVADRVLVASALESLGEPKSTILRLALGEEWTHEEISRKLDLPLGTVKSHVRRGLLQLREKIKEVKSDAL